jgi:hypothetical protein
VVEHLRPGRGQRDNALRLVLPRGSLVDAPAAASPRRQKTSQRIADVSSLPRGCRSCRQSQGTMNNLTIGEPPRRTAFAYYETMAGMGASQAHLRRTRPRANSLNAAALNTPIRSGSALRRPRGVAARLPSGRDGVRRILTDADVSLLTNAGSRHGSPADTATPGRTCSSAGRRTSAGKATFPA